MSPIRALVVDDEPNARRLLRALLGREPDVEVVGESGLGEEAVGIALRARPDVLFLDIELPDMDGFSVIERLAGESGSLPDIVFVTAYDEFALRAFEVHAVDYLLKPFDEVRLGEALERVRQRAERSAPDEIRRDLARLMTTLERRPLDRIAVRDRDESVVLKTGEIDWLEAEENYVRVHVGARAYLARATLQSLEDRLDPERFVRVHRGILVNADRIRRLTPWGHGDLRISLADGTKLKVSRRYRDRLANVLEILR